MQRHYKHVVSDFKNWDQKSHAEKYTTHWQNVGKYISIDELSLSKGELYTFVTNKQGRTKKGSLIASISGTKSADIVDVLDKIEPELREQVLEVTLDMASNMESAVREAFPNADLVTDRFHVVKLAIESLQRVRVKHRWEELDKENKAIKDAREKKQKYIPVKYKNDDTPKQLLARSRYIITKFPKDWTKTQKIRADLLFSHYPNLKIYYEHVNKLREIYEWKDKGKARIEFENWLKETYEKELEVFYTTANTISNHLENILNFFNHRNTNANAESFNAKIKLFRANLRGVTDIPFFLFRLCKLFA